MIYNFPIYKLDRYETEDGKVVEVRTKTDFLSPENISKTNLEIESRDIVYLAVANIMTEMGRMEIKFEIENAPNLQSAFEKYKEVVTEGINAIKEEQENRIVTASGSDIDTLGNNSGLIIP